MARNLCTFNAMNLFVRYRFGRTFPGDRAGKSAVDDPRDGYLPMYDPDFFKLFNREQRDLAARAIRRGEGGDLPDVLCLQEVESLIALREFNARHLRASYPHALLVDSRDHRQIDVAVLSRLPILSLRSHVDDPNPDAATAATQPLLFSRDCLEVEVDLDGEPLVLFINHFKSKLVEGRTAAERAEATAKADAQRRRQAVAVAEIVHARFPGQRFDEALFAVVGDLNDHAEAETVRPLTRDAGLHDAVARIAPEQERWTYYFRSRGELSQIDHMLLSPALAQRTQGRAPVIERRGVPFREVLNDEGIGPRKARYVRREDDPAPVEVDFRFQRFLGVSPERFASDHCPVVLDVG